MSKTLLHAQALSRMDSGPAPKEWEEINHIASAKPKGGVDSVSLQQLDEAPSICLWMVKRGYEWWPASEFFKVDEI